MDSKLITARRTALRRRPLAIAIGASLLLSAGLMTGCDNSDGPKTAGKTPLGQSAGSANDNYATIDGGKVIARINGSPLYRENLEVVKENLGAGVPESRLVSRMVELRLLANQAREQGLDDDPSTQARIQNAVDNQLANTYLTDYLANVEISEEELKAAYEEAVKDLGGEEQHRAAHILVKDEDKARDLLKQIQDGGDFAELAKEHSEDKVSGEAGGDLGWFSLDQMVEPFANAVAELEPGELDDELVETQFGWHIIKLEGVRKSPPPTFEQMRPQLEDSLRRKAVTQKIEELRAEANVEILTDEVRSIVDRDEGTEGEAAPKAEETEDAETEDAADAEGGDRSGMKGLPAEPLKALP
ncbi:peptidylprolyl isomerase [Guyparkeria hydrothermalis]|uniref:peptidylprolyl isomerase n=1 Tax=Guyparkeria hydrothermalis TaxID=923 RepID=UPI0024C3F05F|nr:peptidylprolyl isomerase [Guyparkeria hydrothermalis]